MLRMDLIYYDVCDFHQRRSGRRLPEVPQLYYLVTDPEANSELSAELPLEPAKQTDANVR